MGEIKSKDKIVAKEAADAVIDAVLEYRRQIIHHRPQLVEAAELQRGE